MQGRDRSRWSHLLRFPEGSRLPSGRIEHVEHGYVVVIEVGDVGGVVGLVECEIGGVAADLDLRDEGAARRVGGVVSFSDTAPAANGKAVSATYAVFVAGSTAIASGPAAFGSGTVGAV